MTKKTTRPLVRKRVVKRKKLIVKKAERPVEVFFGTAYEKRIFDVCAENKFPFDYRRAKIKDVVADFTNRDKRLIIEVYNPARSWEEVQVRLKVFLVQGFKTKYITKERLLMRDSETFCTTLIKRFLR